MEKESKTKKKNEGITHAYGHWLADVHSGSFAPALASLIFNSPCRFTTANAPANRQMPIASVVRGKRRKKQIWLKFETTNLNFNLLKRY